MLTLRAPLLLVGFALAACEVADLPPLAAEVTRSDSGDTREAETEDTTAVETTATQAETSEDDTLAEVDDEVSGDSEDEVGDDAVEDADPAEVEVESPEVEDDTSAPGDTSEPDTSACTSTVITHTTTSATHIPACSATTFPSEPPSWGNHYGSWATWGTYTTPIPRGFYVHNMEHGGVVIAYNCPSGCAAELAAIETMLDARAPDPACFAPIKHRFIVTPDPLLQTKFAVLAWGAELTAECVDVVAMTTFIDTWYANPLIAEGHICSQGIDVTNPLTAGTYCPPTCSWCTPATP